MTFDEALKFMMRWQGSRLGLERMIELMDRMGHPERSLRYVHVAGTNGKGSTCAMLESVLRAAGYKTGMFTSPYLTSILESIKIDGENISEDGFSAAVDAVRLAIDGENIPGDDFCPAPDAARRAVDGAEHMLDSNCPTDEDNCPSGGDYTRLPEMGDKPTEFEILTAAAIWAFAHASSDIVIMEVGMGGRLDSTNIIPPPEVCAIVNLSLEHTQFLGDTLAKIAFEKAGIIKKGSYVVTYPVDTEAEDVYRAVCAERGAVWHRADMENAVIAGEKPGVCASSSEPAGEEFGVCGSSSEPVGHESGVCDRGAATPGRQIFSWHGYENLALALPGRQQISNAVMVLEIIEKLRELGWNISGEAVRRGLSRVTWPARFEFLRKKPVFICDGSHNPQCIETLEDNIKRLMPDAKITFLMGVLADKEYDAMLKFLIPHAKAFVCVTPPNPRALKAEALAKIIRDLTEQSAERAMSCEARADNGEKALCGDPALRGDIPVYAEENAAGGVKRALEIAGDDPVIACGSLYIMGEIRKEFLKVADSERLDKLFKFILEADKDKFIGRQNYLSDGRRKENDAEHAWHLAVMAYLLADYANEKIDIAKTMIMVLIHDIVEIDAGDTYAYDDTAKKSQKERELKAADRIFGLLPDDIGEKLRAIWEEFEAWETPEAKFARTLDHVQPLMLNAASCGKSWVEHGVKASQVMKRNERSKFGSEEVWEYAYRNYIEPSVKQGWLADDLQDSDGADM